MPFLGKNAQEVLKARYLLHNENGKIIETPQELFKRVTRTIASSERNYNPTQTKKIIRIFEQAIVLLLAIIAHVLFY